MAEDKHEFAEEINEMVPWVETAMAWAAAAADNVAAEKSVELVA